MSNVHQDSALRHPSRRSLLRAAGLSLTAVALGGCVVVPAGGRYPQHGGYDTQGDVVYQAPPPPQAEVVVAAPGPGYVWIGGYWGWSAGRHMWVPGRWILGRPGHRWVPHAWHPHGRGWRHAPGHWSRH